MRFISAFLFTVTVCYNVFAQPVVDPTRDLFYAIFDMNYELAEHALINGADANAVYTYERYADECRGWTPAYTAAALGNLKLLKLLREKGADLNKPFSGTDLCQKGISLLHAAAAYGSRDIINYLIQDIKLAVNSQAGDGRTALFDAVIHGESETVKLLLDKGADPNIAAKICTSKTVQQPIHFAIEQQRHDLMDLLLDKGYRLNTAESVKPILIYAIECENLQACATLISKGASPSIKNQEGVSAMDLALKSGNQSLIDLFQNGSLSDRDKKILSLLRNDAMKKFKLINQKAPTIQFTNLNGTAVTSASFKGNLLLVNVWATWCSPCIKEMPGFEKLLKKMNRPDIQLLAVSIDQKLYKVQDFVNKNYYPFVFLHDPNANIRSMFDGTVPATFIINKKGDWVAKIEGSIDWDKKEIRTFLEYLANEK